ncbi:MAG: hypothetical protein PVH41_04605 [Anaerolineae bacterium]|jgi:hypothetical protein
MNCYADFPISAVIYNLTALGALMALGVVAAIQFGTGVLVVYVLLLAIALVGTLSTVCSRCAGYYGRRCGLGLGKVVALLFRKRPANEYLRTPAQFVIIVLLVAALAWPIVGGALLLVRGFAVALVAQLLAAVVLLLAFAVPHPRLSCRHCRQGESGACPIGRRVRRAKE